MKIRIQIKDSKTLKDSIEATKKKILDAEFDLTQKGVASIANKLLEKKEEISATTGFADLRDLVKGQLAGFDTPKSREILQKVDEFDRLFQRDPRPGSRNDYWMWDKLLKYVYNILLKASGNESPDVVLKREYEERKGKKDSALKDVVVYAEYKGNQPGDFWLYSVEEGLDANDRFAPDKSKAHKFPSIAEAKKFCEEHGIEDFEIQDSSCEAKDEQPSELDKQLLEIIRLIGEAHNNVMEAQEIANDLDREGKINPDLGYALDDLEADLSELDFEGNDNGLEALKEEFQISEGLDPEDESEGWDGDAEDWDVGGEE